MKTYNTHPGQAIVTRFYGPTNFKGSRIKARCSRGSITVQFPYDLSGADCHAYAVALLLQKFSKEDGNAYSWGELEDWAVGGMPDQDADEYCFVRVGGVK